VLVTVDASLSQHSLGAKPSSFLSSMLQILAVRHGSTRCDGGTSSAKDSPSSWVISLLDARGARGSNGTGL